jgi:hypothetical protein
LFLLKQTGESDPAETGPGSLEKMASIDRLEEVHGVVSC